MNVQQRLEGVSNEDLSIRNPIHGLFIKFQQAEPTFSTREAVIEDLLPLSQNRQILIDPDELMTVLHSCEVEATRKIARDEVCVGLSHSYITMLYLYTAQFYEANSFYGVLNQVLRDENREAVKPLRRLIWILMWALNYCPAYSGRLVYRGVKKNIAAEYIIGKEFSWLQFSSCSCDVTAQEDDHFTGSEGDRTLFNIELSTNRARVISDYSWFPNEKEALLPANSCFRVVGNAYLGFGLYQIQLLEIAPNDPILLFQESNLHLPNPPNPPNPPVPLILPTESQISSLCVEEVQMLLDALSYPNLKAKFLEHNIDGKILAHISSIEELVELDIKRAFVTPFFIWLQKIRISTASCEIIERVKADYQLRVQVRIETERIERERLPLETKLPVEGEGRETILNKAFECKVTLLGQTSDVNPLVVLHDGRIASGSDDTSIKLWDATSQQCVGILSGHSRAVYSLAVLPNGLLASGSWDRSIRLWDVTSQKCVCTLTGHSRAVYSLVALPNGLLASGSVDSSIKLWNTTSCRWVATLSGHKHCVRSLALLRDGRLASGSEDKSIKLWDLHSRLCVATLLGHKEDVHSLAVLPDGRLVSGSDDNTIKVWDVILQECVASLLGHTNWVRSLAVLPDGRLASGSFDTTIMLWDMSSLQCVATLSEHSNGVYTLGVLPNGWLVSGSLDKTIKLWG